MASHEEILADLKNRLGEAEFGRVTMESRLFWQSSLKCQRCGNSCVISDPVVLVEEDVQKIAKRFKIPYQKALRKYTKVLPDGRRSIKYLTPCKFLDSKTKLCRIYEDRPEVCRKYPFLAATPAFVFPGECPASMELYNSAKKKYEKIPDDPTYQALTKIFDANPALREAFRFLNFHALAVRAGEISEGEAMQRLSGYPNQKALNLAGAIGCAIFEQREIVNA